jgi:hypothetical protein
MKLPADQRAFLATAAVKDPEQRLAALRQFLKDYPKADPGRIHRVQQAILKLLLRYFPERTSEIHAQAKLLVKKSGKGMSKWYAETDVAESLADAGPNGVDLSAAERWAQDVADKQTEASFNKVVIASSKKYKQPPLKAAEVHKYWSEVHAEAVAALADVYLHQGKLDQAKSLLAQAETLYSHLDTASSLRGQIALLEHRDRDALDDFERAQLLGELKSPWREKMVELYKEAHNGGDAGLTSELDVRYAQLFPAPFLASKRAAVEGGHTVLMELFTGSGCPPCVGGDLAVEGLLDSYSRADVVALAFDQHIPEPDPLANPDSVARATLYGVASTPSYVLDGKRLTVSGGGRDESEGFYNSFVKSVDKDAANPTGVQLHLTASSDAGGLVRAQAVVVTAGSQELMEKIVAAAPPEPVQGEKKAAPAAAATAAATPGAVVPAEPHLVLNFALVEDEVRYSGENGVRFHRMVVRSLAKPADGGFAVEPERTAILNATFNLEEISRKLLEYLDDYETNNARFGRIEFLTKDTTMQSSHLAVAAWVQDSVTHRVLQAAFVPVQAER